MKWALHEKKGVPASPRSSLPAMIFQLISSTVLPKRLELYTPSFAQGKGATEGGHKAHNKRTNQDSTIPTATILCYSQSGGCASKISSRHRYRSARCVHIFRQHRNLSDLWIEIPVLNVRHSKSTTYVQRIRGIQLSVAYAEALNSS